MSSYNSVSFDDNDSFESCAGAIIMAVMIGIAVWAMFSIDKKEDVEQAVDTTINQEVMVEYCEKEESECKSECDKNSYYPEDCYKWCDDEKGYCEEKEN